MHLPEAYAPLRYSSGQIDAAQWPSLKHAGLQVVINLRPGNEQPGEDEAAQVQAAGLAYHHLPIANGDDLGPDRVAQLDQLLQAHHAQAVLIHCASGNRVGALVALHAAWHQGLPLEQAMALGRRAGLRNLEPRVRQLLQAG